MRPLKHSHIHPASKKKKKYLLYTIIKFILKFQNIIKLYYIYIAQSVKESAMQETVRFLGEEDPLEKMATPLK